MDYKLVPIDTAEEREELVNMLKDGWFLHGGPVGDTQTKWNEFEEDYNTFTILYQAVVKKNVMLQMDKAGAIRAVEGLD